MNKSKGFTIIELIVVIAIIAILAAIVLVNVTSYINKANDAAIKEDMNTILVNAQSYFAINGNYTDFFSDTGYTGSANAIQGLNGGAAVFKSTNLLDSPPNTHFCICSPLSAISNDVYCIDDTGKQVEITTFHGSCSLECQVVGTCH